MEFIQHKFDLLNSISILRFQRSHTSEMPHLALDRQAQTSKVLLMITPTPPAIPPHGLTVLVVDDDAWTLRALTLTLKQEPAIASITTACDGREAIDTHSSSRPDVILMDLNMSPGMGGIAAIEEIYRRDPTTCIVVLTTVSPGPGLARALEAGAMAAVRKTASESELRAVVLAAARGDEPILLKRLVQDIVISGDALPDTPAIAPRLTPTEHEVLLLITDGLGYEEIAERQGITPWTAKSHVKRLREKLYAENLAQLVVRALQYRYVSG